MTEEEKYINNLFEAARKESPKRSYDEVANHFEQMVSTPPITSSWSKLFLNYINLNTILMTTISSLLIAGFFLFLPATQDDTIIETATIPATESSAYTQEIPTKNNQLVVEKAKEVPIAPSPKINANINANFNSKSKTKSVPKQIPPTTNSKEQFTPAPTNKLAETGDLTNPTKTIRPSSIDIPKLATRGLPNSSIIEEPSILINANTAITPKTKLPNKQAELLRLRYTDDDRLATTFLEKIRSYGFSLTEKVNRTAGKIERFNLHISLLGGLDWKIKLRNFEVFELKILLDENKNPIGLAYRMSETGKFSATISLNSRARSSHKFSKRRSKGQHSFTKERSNK